MTNKRKMTHEAITPNLQKRLEELFADSPLKDEPLTPEQEEAVDRLMRQLRASQTDEQWGAIAGQEDN